MNNVFGFIVLFKSYIAQTSQREVNHLDKYLIVTNNPLISEKFNNHTLIDGGFLEVMLAVRDLIYEGKYRLITHPLPASSRMFLTPARSIIIGKSDADSFSMELIQQSIDNYIKIVGRRKPDYNYLENYQDLDYRLLLKAIEEQAKFDKEIEPLLMDKIKVN